MNNQEELFGFLLETLKQTKDFTTEQAPLVAKEMLAYGAWEAQTTLWLLPLILVLFIGLTLFFYKLHKRTKSYDSGFEVLATLSGAAFVVTVVATLLLVPCAYFTLKKIETAPRVYLIEKLSKAAE